MPAVLPQKKNRREVAPPAVETTPTVVLTAS
jgi:hypothetical protein